MVWVFGRGEGWEQHKMKRPSPKQFLNCSFPNIGLQDVMGSPWTPGEKSSLTCTWMPLSIYFLPYLFFRHSAAWGPGRAAKRRAESGKLLGSYSQKGDLGIFHPFAFTEFMCVWEESNALGRFSREFPFILSGPAFWLHTLLIEAF